MYYPWGHLLHVFTCQKSHTRTIHFHYNFLTWFFLKKFLKSCRFTSIKNQKMVKKSEKYPFFLGGKIFENRFKNTPFFWFVQNHNGEVAQKSSKLWCFEHFLKTHFLKIIRKVYYPWGHLLCIFTCQKSHTRTIHFHYNFFSTLFGK